MTSIDLEVVSGSSSAKRVLVTGATGFIGQHCLHYLVNEGFEVHAMSRSRHKTGVDDDGVHWYLTDLFNSGSQDCTLHGMQNLVISGQQLKIFNA